MEHPRLAQHHRVSTFALRPLWRDQGIPLEIIPEKIVVPVHQPHFEMIFDTQGRLRSSWNSEKLLMRGKLTDKKIEQYRKRGWYSEEFRQSRRELMARKAQKSRREGSFIRGTDGALIYSPV